MFVSEKCHPHVRLQAGQDRHVHMLHAVYVRSDPDDNNAVDECAVDQIW